MKSISIDANLRPYTYKVQVHLNSVRIYAGCRKWSSFEQAFAHYAEANDTGWFVHDKWKDTTAERDYAATVANYGLMLAERNWSHWWAHRAEARAILRKLRHRAELAQVNMRLENRRKRKTVKRAKRVIRRKRRS